MTEADTRTKIVDAAARLFHEQGFNATAVSTILREAGVNSGSLYYIFESKEALLVGVLERYTELLHPVVMAPVEARTADPIERVFMLMEQYRGWMAPVQFSMSCPIGNLALEVGGGPARELVRKNFEGWIAAVRGWLEAAGERLPRDCDRGRLAQFVLTVMEGGVMQARAAGEPGPFDASVAELRGYFGALVERAERELTERKA